MDETLRREDNLSKSPAILHQHMTDSDYAKILTTYSYSVRVSESIVPDTVIFPLSRVAFLIVPLNSCLSGSGQLDIKEDLVQRIDKFIQVHRNRYVLCQASTFAEQECQAFSFIQQQYFKNRLQLLPCHNAEGGVKAMITIAKLLCRPTCQEMNYRLQHLLSQQLKKDSATEFLKQMGLSDHQVSFRTCVECVMKREIIVLLREISLLKDGIGNLDKISKASEEELLNCSLDSDTVTRILKIFNQRAP